MQLLTPRRDDGSSIPQSAKRKAPSERICVGCGAGLLDRAPQAKRCGACHLEFHRERKRNLAKRMYDADPEKFRARSAEFRSENKDLVAESIRRWREREGEDLLARRREQYWSDPDKFRDMAKRWASRHAEKVRRSRKALNAKPERKEAMRLYKHRRRARMAGLDSPGVTPKQWRDTLSWFGNRCAYCLRVAPLTVDHVVPIACGGVDSIENIVPACKSCNCSKGAKSLLEWTRRGGCENRGPT